MKNLLKSVLSMFRSRSKEGQQNDQSTSDEVRLVLTGSSFALTGPDYRPWVLEHYAWPGELQKWHFYHRGHYELAICGKGSISGSPLCCSDPVQHGDATAVCQECQKLR